MKRYLIKSVALWLTAATLCVACGEDSASSTVAPELSIDTTEQAFLSPEATEFVVEVSTNNDMTTVSSDRSWCQPSVEVTSSGEVVIVVSTNSSRFEREARITFTNDTEQQQVVVSQPRGEFSAGMRYEIPVVFHVVYNNENSQQHNPPSSKIYELFDTMSSLFDECGVDVGIDFVLAEEDADGVTLEERGINRIYQSLGTMECLNVMYDSSRKYTYLCWDPRRYLNVTLYEFGDEYAIVGLSRAPYLIEPYELEGVDVLKSYTHPDDLNFVYTISLNNAYLYMEESEVYNMYDLGSTLAHEIGHYLGLFHPYSETYDNYGSYNTCDDTDYCVDTPSYNRYYYEEVMFYTNMYYIFSDEDIEALSYRTSCEDDSSFRSTNIMDYAVGDSDAFSEDQLIRMRYILENSPYIPGCKSTDFEAISPVASGVAAQDVPLNTVVCRPVHRH